MAVIIQNMGPVGGNVPSICRYDIRINQTLLAQTAHERGEGLAVLLRKAADAVEEADRAREAYEVEQFAKMIQRVVRKEGP